MLFVCMREIKRTKGQRAVMLISWHAFRQVIREDLPKKVTFEQRPE